ncbi:hypothetical protein HW555_013491 [Spodoptera exigua]|uniref:protein acetyllysine N-acetyltransferase n=1 Tax=Spodoptera exigua TaxID=7107 RepID=A0A835KYL7_SPOEX|nr:hypothetical protein HW555_013491 [Spodoptera exigua]
MSCNYADGLSPYENKGILGVPEKFDSIEKFNKKCELLAQLINQANHVVVHTGAGISTSAGIPDFRGPNGVWTLEKEGKRPTTNISFADAVPTKTHMILKKLVECNKVHYVVSQNIDGLHLKSGLSRKYLAELHGNMFIDECNLCKRQFVRSSPVETVGKKCSGVPCAAEHVTGRPCRGRLYDGVLDWEHSLPENDLTMAEWHSSIADLSICLGSTLQIVPSGNLPLETVKYDGKLVICNLQPTKHVSTLLFKESLFFYCVVVSSKTRNYVFTEYIVFCSLNNKAITFQDNKADLIINYYVDDVLEKVMNILNIDIPTYNEDDNPIKRADTAIIDWTIDRRDVLSLEKRYKAKCKGVKKKRILIKNKRNSTEINSENGIIDDKTKIIKLELKEEQNGDVEVKPEPADMAMSNEQFQQLLSTITANKRGTFASCTFTYDGKKNSDAVEAFLAAATVFKSTEKISDSDALQSLPLLLRDEAAVWWQGTVGKKCSGVPCAAEHVTGRPCRGRLYDGVLDWEHSLPENDLTMAEWHSSIADLSICLGTTLQIVPSGNLPLETVKYDGKLVICNLQPTKHDNKADLIINYYVDDVLEKVMNILNIDIPTYNEDDNPIKRADTAIIDWTIDRRDVLSLEKRYKAKCKGVKKKRILIKNKRNSTEINSENGISDDKTKIIKLEIKEEQNGDVEVKPEPADVSVNGQCADE